MSSVANIRPQSFAGEGAPEVIQSTFFALANAFACDAKLFTDLFEREGVLPSYSEPECQDESVALRQDFHATGDLELEVVSVDCILGLGHAIIHQGIQEGHLEAFP